MAKPKCILFDMDGTLFNHERSSIIALRKVYNSNEKLFKYISYDLFVKTYSNINDLLWKLSECGVISIDDVIRYRFIEFCNLLSISAHYGPLFNKVYLKSYIYSCQLMHGALSTIKILKSKGYDLALCSNGRPYVQDKKLKRKNLMQYFPKRYYASRYPLCKPNHEYYLNVVNLLNQKASDIVLVGDSYHYDIKPAKELGIPFIWINKNNCKNKHNIVANGHIVQHIREIANIL